MPNRYVQVHLVDPSHKLPVPGTKRLFPTAPEGELVDIYNPFWQALLKDGSVARGARPAPPPQEAAASAPQEAPAPAPAPAAASATHPSS